MNKNVIIALVVFVGLLGAVLVLRSRDSKVGVKELKVATVDPEQVSKIEITLPPKEAPKPPGKDGADPAPAAATEPAKTVVLEKSGTAWSVYDAAAADKKFPVEESALKGALDAIGEFKPGDLISTKAEKLAELEIDDAKGTRVKITSSTGNLDLLFGRAAKAGGSTVRVAGQNDVYVAKGRLGPTVKKDVAQWRKKTLVDVKAEELTAVTVTPATGTGFTVTASAPPPSEPPPDGGVADLPKPEWKLTAPATLPDGFRLDESQLARMAQSFAGLRAQDFADAPPADAFPEPHTILEGKKTDGKSVVVHFGKEDDKKRVYTKVDGDAQVYLLSSYTTKQAGKSLDDLRSLTLLDAKPEDVERISIKGSTGTITVAKDAKKDGEAWTLVEPKTAPPDFDASQVPTQLGAILRMKGTKLAAADAKATAGNGPVIELTLKGGKKQTVKFGAGVPLEDDKPAEGADKDKKAPEKKKEPREYYVTGSADTQTYVIAAFTRNRYDKALEIFKKPAAPPPGMGGPGGGMQGLENLPPDVRKQIEASMRQQAH